MSKWLGKYVKGDILKIASVSTVSVHDLSVSNILSASNGISTTPENSTDNTDTVEKNYSVSTVSVLNSSNLKNSTAQNNAKKSKELIEKYFGKTRELTPEEHRLLNENDIKQFYLNRGLSLTDLTELRDDLETLSDKQAAEVAKTLNAEKGKPVNDLKLWGITAQELKEFLGEEWQDYKDNPEGLGAWAKLLYERRLMEQGIVPDRYIASVYCEECRDYVPVPPSMVTTNKVIHCTWCSNRVKGLPVPKVL